MRGTAPGVSILLPIRDAAETLDDCLASLAAQSFQDWECLAVDDGSVDSTAEVLERWAERDSRILPSRVPRPGGIVAALEEARRRARAETLARQDADDRSLPGRLEAQLRALLAMPGLAVLGCATADDRPTGAGMCRYLDWLATCSDAERCARAIWIESPIAHPTAMIRAAWLDRVGGYRERGWPEDYDLWLRIHRAGGRMASLPEIHYIWRGRPVRSLAGSLEELPGAFLLVAVGVAGAREEIRPVLRQAGLREGADFLCLH